MKFHQETFHFSTELGVTNRWFDRSIQIFVHGFNSMFYFGILVCLSHSAKGPWRRNKQFETCTKSHKLVKRLHSKLPEFSLLHISSTLSCKALQSMRRGGQLLDGDRVDGQLVTWWKGWDISYISRVGELMWFLQWQRFFIDILVKGNCRLCLL